ncbi:MAG: secretion system protein F [Rhodoferax sp.]|uniref:type II secretion system F family protein n=1 Tax=Rhodoferax sp. TaxID=50421 RepID=UPI001857BDC6|nr:type II secretion system F family protein [Rhodoferax sp.]NMM13672.1 secretion system protein F [Rhodoferax sp.]NMM20511.1 secretion system protein F [Rhodoferax sp.]
MFEFAFLIGVVVAAAIVIGMVGMLLVRSWLNHQQATLATTAKTDLAAMFIFIDPKLLFKYSVGALVVIPILLLVVLDNPLVAVVSGVVVAFTPRYFVKHLQKSRITLFEKQLPDALLMVSGGMRAGASLAVALESMVKEQKPPLAQEFDLMLREQRLGVDFDSALSNMEKRMPLPDFVLLVAAMKITREVGGNFAEILESLSGTLRRKHEMEGKIKALTAQGKLQGIVMALLPVFLLAILTFMEPDAMAPLYNTLYGWGVLLVVSIMITIGYIGIQKIVNIDV